MSQPSARVTVESEILDLVIATIVEIVPDVADQVHPSSRFAEDLDMDSLHLMELVAQIETALAIEIPGAVEAAARTPAEFTRELRRLEGVG